MRLIHSCVSSVAVRLFFSIFLLTSVCLGQATEVTTTALTTSGSPANAGTVVTLTATVTGSSTPTGRVIFKEGTKVIGYGPVTAGVATFKSNWLRPGTHSITAEYKGDATFLPSTSSAVTQDIGNAVTVNTIASSFNPANLGFPVTLTSTLTTSAGGAPTGSVNFVESPTVVGSGALSGSSLLLGAPTSYTPGSGPGFYDNGVAADVNLDGKMDLITRTSQTLYAQLGNGDGTFQTAIGKFFSPALFACQGGPTEVGDFNADGKPDVIMVGRCSDNAGIFLGNGDGTFQNPTTFSAGSQPNSLAVGDFNGDGKDDFLIVARVQQAINLYINNGDGTFAARADYGGVPYPTWAVTADLNNDGRSDVVYVGDVQPVTFAVRYGNADGTLTTNANHGLPNQSYPRMAIGDVNNDGILDLVFTYDYLQNKLAIWQGAADGTFAFTRQYSIGARPYGLVLTDFDGDGALDAATSHYEGNSINVLQGNGDGTFDAAQSYTFSPASTSSQFHMFAGDFNGGGLPELTVSQTSPVSKFYIFPFTTSSTASYTDSTYTFGVHPFTAEYGGNSYFSASSSGVLNQAIVNATSTAIVASANPTVFGTSVTFTATVTSGAGLPTGSVEFREGSTLLGTSVVDSGTGVATLDISTLAGGNHTIVAAYLGDSNFGPSVSSGLAHAVSATGTSTVLIRTSGADPSTGGAVLTFEATVTGTSGIPRGHVAFKDGSTTLGTSALNGTGVATLATNKVGSGTRSITAVYQGTLSHSGSTSTALSHTVNGASVVAISSNTATSAYGQNVTFTGTVNARQGAANPTGSVAFMEGTTTLGTGLLGSASAGFSSPVYIGTSSSPYGIAAADFNRDGKMDVVVPQQQSASIRVFMGNGDGTLQGGIDYSGAAYGTKIVVADFNNDGAPDIAIDNTPQDKFEFGVFMNNGNGTFAAIARTNNFERVSGLATGDLNGDGNMDLLATSSTSNLVRLYLGNGNGTFAAAVSYATGSQPSQIETGDLNNDGKLDVVLQNNDYYASSTAIYLGNGDGTLQTPTTLSVANQPSTLKLADFNSDGNLDLAEGAANGGLSIRLGNGNGTFANASTYNVYQALFIDVADIDLDGDLDIAVATYNGRNITVVRNNGNGTFSNSFSAYDAGNNYTYGILAVDLDGGGRPDLLALDIFSSRFIKVMNQVSASATLTTNALAVGSHDVFAKYLGDSSYGEADSATTNVAVSAAASTTAVTSNLNPAHILSNVTFTATVTPASGGAATGTISFREDDVEFANVAVGASNQATTSRTDLATGNHNITAVYSGDGNLSGSTSSNLVQVVDGYYDSTTTLLSSLNPSTFGDSVTFTVTVTTMGSTPTGNVVFKNGTTALATVALSTPGSASPESSVAVPGASASATFSISSLASGTHSITAEYVGDAFIAASNSAALSQLVNKQATATTLALNSTEPVAHGAVAQFTATVTPSAAGTVQFKEGSTMVATATLVNGGSSSSAIGFIRGLSGGTHNITAHFLGSLNHLGSNSTATSVEISKATSSITLMATPNPSGLGDAVTFTGTVKAGGTGLLSGTMDLKEGTSTLGTATLTNSMHGYGAAVQYSVGTTLSPVIAADVNNDGVKDLVGIATGYAALGKMLGNADGSFQALVTTAVNGTPNRIALGDFNGDGFPDAVVARESGQDLMVLMNNGSGAFTAGPLLSMGGSPSYGVGVADFNGDGKLDIVATRYYNQQVRVIDGVGDGTFSTVRDSSTPGYYPRELSVGDLNNDGTPDLLMSADGTSLITKLGNGDGYFATSVTISAGGNLNSVALADLNADNNLDAVVTRSSGLAGVALGNGNGTLQTVATYAVGSSPSTAAIADINYDGFLDLVVSNAGASNLSLLNGTGTGTFAAAISRSTPSIARYVVITDVHGDGRFDFVVPGNNSQIAIIPGQVTATAAVILSDLTFGSHNITAAFSGDAGFLTSTSGSLTQVVQSATSTALASSLNPSTYPEEVVFTATVTSTDGTPDGNVSFYDGATLLNTTALSSGTATFSTQLLAGGTHSITAVYAGSANGFQTSTSAAVSQVVNPRATSISFSTNANPAAINNFSVSATVTSASGTPAGTVEFREGTVVVGTINLSGGTAAGALSLTAGSHTLTAVYLGNANYISSTSPEIIQSILNPVTLTLTGPATSFTPGTVTFTAEILGYNNSIPTGTLDLKDGTDVIATSPLTAAGTRQGAPVQASLCGGNGVTAADFNNDGKKDLVFISCNSYINVKMGNGDGTFTSSGFSSAGGYATATTAADVNGDGYADLLMTDANYDRVELYLNNAGTGFTYSSAFGVSYYPYAITTGDFDGDGHKDFAAANYYDYYVTAYYGASDGTFSNRTDVYVNDQPSGLTARDLNGDGRDDLVVTLYYTGLFTVTGNANRTFSDGSFAYGGYYLVSSSSADFNGDNIKDVIVGSDSDYYVHLFLGNADGSFQNGSTIYTSSYTYHVGAGDVDGDGKADFIAPLYYNNQIEWRKGNGDGTFQSAVYFASTNPYSATVAEVNSTAKADIIAVGGQFTLVMDNETSLGAVFPVTSLTAGSHSLTAVYAGDSIHTAKISNTLSHAVSNVTTTALATSATPQYYGNTVTLTATITGGNPGGSVEFMEGSTVLGTGTVTSGVATLNISSLAIGTHSLTASYLGDSTHAASASAVMSQIITDPITLTASSRNFGNGAVGDTTPAFNVFLSNASTAAVTINSTVASGDFATAGTCSTSIPARSYCSLAITFTASTTGARTGSITVSTPIGAYLVTLSGTGVNPLVVAVATTNLGKHAIGATSPAATVTVVNNRFTAASVSSISIGGEFSQTNTCGSSIPARSICNVTVVLSPTSVGAKSQTLSIATASDSASINFTGTGVNAVQVSMAASDLGRYPIGSTSPAAAFSVVNYLYTPVSVTSVSISGNFAQSNSCGTTIPARGSCTGSVTFTPASVGPLTGTLSVATSASTATAGVTGTGVTSIQVSSSVSDMSKVPVGGVSPTAAVVSIVNYQYTPITVSSISITGGEFSQTNTCGTTIPARGSCTAAVLFAPSSVGLKSTTFSVVTSAGSGSLNFTGTGVEPVTLYSSVSDFGKQAIGLSSPVTAVVSITNFTYTPASVALITASAEFSQTNTCGTSIPARGSCTATVTFAPTSVGAKSGSLAVNTSAGNSSVNFTGTGVEPLLTASGWTTFGNQAIGTSSPASLVTIINYRHVSVTVTSISIGSEFTQTNNCGSSIPARSSCTATVRLEPTTAGAKAGTLTVVTSSDTSSINFTGTGVPALSITSGASDFGNLKVGNTSAQITVYIFNYRYTAVSVNSISIDPDFVQTNTCGTSIAARSGCTASVRFQPTTTGPKAGAFTIVTSADTGTLGFTGNGTP